MLMVLLFSFFAYGEPDFLESPDLTKENSETTKTSGFFLAPLQSAELSERQKSEIMAVLQQHFTQDQVLYSVLDENTISLSHDSASDYIISCFDKDRKDYRICVSEVGDVNGWEYTIAIDVQWYEETYWITTWIINAETKEEVGTTELEVLSLQEWAELISKTSQLVLQEGIILKDIRQGEPNISQVLARIKKKLKGTTVKDVAIVGPVESTRADLRKEDLIRLEKEEVPPWEEYDLSKHQYMEFYNAQNRLSNFTLSKYRSRKNGQFGYLTLSGGVGGMYLPTKGYYYGYRLRNVDLDRVLETYTEQTLQNSPTFITEFALGIGILPQIEIAFFGGQGLSSYETSLWWISSDGSTPSNSENSVARSMTYYGGRMIISIPAIFRVSPGLAVSASYWTGLGGHDYLRPSIQEEFPAMIAPTILVLAVEPRLAIRLSDTMDLWIQTPLTYSIAENAPDSQQTVRELEYSDRLTVEHFSPFGFGGMLGLQLQIPIFVPSFD